MSAFGYSHYDYLNDYLWDFLEAVGVNTRWCRGLIGAHGDKCYCYRQEWEEAGIPFPHGVAIYLAARVQPFAGEFEMQQREAKEDLNRWYHIEQWVIDNYDRFKEHLPPVPKKYYEDN